MYKLLIYIHNATAISYSFKDLTSSRRFACPISGNIHLSVGCIRRNAQWFPTPRLEKMI